MTTTNVLFEVGLEEMPARFMNGTKKQLHEKTVAWLKELRLSYTTLNTFITPRRFAVVIEGLETKQADQEEEVKGPAVKIAQDDNGNWTKAAIGFTKGQGKDVDDIYVKQVNGTDYIFVKKFLEGKSVAELLPGFKDIILSLHFPKNMRWANQSLRYIRPIKWLVALRDAEVIPFDITNVTTGNVTYGHRFLGEKTVITDPLAYVRILEEQFVIVDAEERQKRIVDGIKQLEVEHNWKIPIDVALLEEVTNLVEYPTVFFGTYDESFLHLPKEVLITSMKEHQRYFPVQDDQGELYPFFVAVRNGTAKHIETVARGNEKVLRARLQDAQFFYEADQEQSIDRNLEQLSRMVFQEKLGTIADKVKRVTSIAELIALQLELDNETTTKVSRASEICKFDLVTNMVNEFTELQGVMGRKYAEIFGEDPIVAKAIEEHYMPTSATGSLPETTVGAIVSIADKLDTIVGSFTVGLIPSGSQDPYALRRQALGIIQIIIARDWTLNMSELLKGVQELFDQFLTDMSEKITVNEQLETFFKQRVAYIMKEESVETDVIDAVLVNELANISFMKEKAHYLSEKRHDETFKAKQEAFVRVLNLAKKAKEDNEINPTLFVNNEEKRLYEEYMNVKEEYEAKLQVNNANEAIAVLSQLVEPIEAFFEHTMVMDKDEQIRENRLALLRSISKEIILFAELSEINWKQTQG